jgi:hypothetical protein
MAKEQYGKEVNFISPLSLEDLKNLKRCDYAGNELFNKENSSSFCMEPRNVSHICTTVRCPLIILDKKSFVDIFKKQ